MSDLEHDKYIRVRDLINFYIDIDTRNYEVDFKYSYSKADKGNSRDRHAKKFADRIEEVSKSSTISIFNVKDHLFTETELENNDISDNDAVINLLMNNPMDKRTEYQRLLFNNHLCKELITKPYIYIYGSDGTRILNQKWHLLISVYAYLEVINNIFPY